MEVVRLSPATKVKLARLKDREARLSFLLAYAELGFEDELLEVIAKCLDIKKEREKILKLFEDSDPEGVLISVVKSKNFYKNYENLMEELEKHVPRKKLDRVLGAAKKNFDQFIAERDQLADSLLKNGQDLKKFCSFLWEI